MAVAVKTPPEASTSASPFDRLPVASLVGIVYLVSSLAIVFKLVPALWGQWWGTMGGPFASVVLMGLVMVAAAVGLIVGANRVVGQRPLHGLRAGIFVGFTGLLLVLMVTRWISLWVEYYTYQQGWFGASGESTGAIIVGVIGVALLIGFLRWFFSPSCEKFLKGFEDQGWFSAVSYKKNQGVKVRRGTVLGIMIVLGSGIYTLVNHDTLGKDKPDWTFNIPFTGTKIVAGETVIHYTDGDTKRERTLVGDLGDAESHVENLKASVTPETVAFQKLIDRKTDQVLVQVPSKVNGVDMSYEVYLPVDEHGKLPRTITGEATRKYFVMDRYQLRDANKNVDPNIYVKINNPAKIQGMIQDLNKDEVDLDTMDGKLVLKKVYNDARDQAGKDGKPFPEATPPEPAEGVTHFAGITLLPQVKFTVPLLLLGLSIWFAWRIVNLPVFADFLIATEAELNKVSWTTRKRLFQDTVVVLITVFLMSSYLFLMDQVWAHVLSSWPINVIVINPDKSKANQDAEGKW